ncbi:MAG: glycosyltransferase [Deltaproteobacteria bacterium]|jgi:tetratricopeptide (TPR) repeat protein|nr:glycosyltransferase [Deltaproteobacteria bacterium]
MLILCLGSEYFHEAFHKMGHSVISPEHSEGYPVDTLFNNLRDRPDLIVYTDHLGKHVWPDGLSRVFGVPKVYYAVDGPINYWWQGHFARLFDYVFTDQKEQAAALNDEGRPASWLPVGVDAKSYLSADDSQEKKIYDFGFVGALDPERRAKRSRLVNTLSRRYSLKTAGARDDGWVGPDESGQIYRQSKLALNENLFPGVTMRMLEAMASGAVLFTEKAGGDLGELFKPGEDFAWFEPQELMETAELWLKDAGLRRRAAKRAQEKAHSAHDIQNRAESFMSQISGLNPGFALYDEEALDREGRFLFLTALRWPAESGQQRIVRAEKLLREADRMDKISPEGLFMLGHVQRLKGRSPEAKELLGRAFERGEPRGALGMGILCLGEKNPKEASLWLGRFTGTGSFPDLALDTLSFEAVKLLGNRLLELGEDVCPGFSRAPHDPALWTAFEFFQTGYQGNPADLEITRPLAQLLFNRGAAAEAMEVSQRGLEFHPGDPILGSIFTEAGKASYLTVN